MAQVGSDYLWIDDHSGETTGIIVREEVGFVFHAAGKDVREFDRQVFPTMHAAQRAARQAAIEAKARILRRLMTK